VVEVTGSTQDDLAAGIASKRVKPGDVLVTEFQSAGRGRLDRTFEAPKNSALLFSVYIQPKCEKSEWAFIPLLAGLATSLAITTLNPEISVELKWPNDLQIKERKVGGIIAQLAGDGVILGIGLNVGMTHDELPVEDATSLSIEGSNSLDRNLLLVALLDSLEEILGRWESGEDLRHLYRERSSTLGKRVGVELPDGKTKMGVAEDISPDGELILDDGQRITVGDIVHLR
jgi:BirA family biotin operon repressor/biotin-[acetyl-CoA-carboxylase] ligase